MSIKKAKIKRCTLCLLVCSTFHVLVKRLHLETSPLFISVYINSLRPSCYQVSGEDRRRCPTKDSSFVQCYCLRQIIWLLPLTIPLFSRLWLHDRRFLLWSPFTVAFLFSPPPPSCTVGTNCANCVKAKKFLVLNQSKENLQYDWHSDLSFHGLSPPENALPLLCGRQVSRLWLIGRSRSSTDAAMKIELVALSFTNRDPFPFQTTNHHRGVKKSVTQLPKPSMIMWGMWKWLSVSLRSPDEGRVNEPQSWDTLLGYIHHSVVM